MGYPAEIVAAAQKLAELMDHPWELMAEGGKQEMCRLAQGVIREYHKEVVAKAERELE